MAVIGQPPLFQPCRLSRACVELMWVKRCWSLPKEGSEWPEGEREVRDLEGRKVHFWAGKISPGGSWDGSGSRGSVATTDGSRDTPGNRGRREEGRTWREGLSKGRREMQEEGRE